MHINYYKVSTNKEKKLNTKLKKSEIRKNICNFIQNTLTKALN